MVDVNHKTVASVVYNKENEEIRPVNPQLRTRQPRCEDQVIKNIVACHNDMTLKEISDELFIRIGVSKSVATIGRKLKELGITRKRLSLIPVERNSLDKINQRSIYASENLVFLDETGFNDHTSRYYGYSQQNVKAYRNVPASKGQNLSCMCVISFDGLVAHEHKRGAYNSELFMDFIECYLVDYFRSHPEKILMIDNARFHHYRAVIQKLDSLNFRISFYLLTHYS